jgi:hypothetical protein
MSRFVKSIQTDDMQRKQLDMIRRDAALPFVPKRTEKRYQTQIIRIGTPEYSAVARGEGEKGGERRGEERNGSLRANHMMPLSSELWPEGAWHMHVKFKVQLTNHYLIQPSDDYICCVSPQTSIALYLIADLMQEALVLLPDIPSDPYVSQDLAFVATPLCPSTPSHCSSPTFIQSIKTIRSTTSKRRTSFVDGS